MKRILAIVTGVGLAAGLAGCGSNDNPVSSLTGASGGSTTGTTTTSPPVTTTPSVTTFSTTDILAQARLSSETSTPYQVDNGAVVLSGTSETTAPTAID